MVKYKYLDNLVRYIVFEIIDDGYTVFRTRLVKLLYLLDIDYYRSYGKTITGIEWMRYLYGPYSNELEDLGQKMGFNFSEEEYDFKYGNGIKVTVEEPPNPEKWLDSQVKVIVDRVIDTWGNEDLDSLLDYVYCDTAPMYNAQFGEHLDFSKEQVGLRYKPRLVLDIGEENIRKISELVKKHGSISEPCKKVKRVSDKSIIYGITQEDQTPSIIGGTITFDDDNIWMYGED